MLHASPGNKGVTFRVDQQVNSITDTSAMPYRSTPVSPQLDGRTVIARRQRALANAFILALGGPDRVSAVQMADIKRAAELGALAEATRSRIMRVGATGASELTALIRLEGTASRAQRALGIKPGASAPIPTLAEHLASRTTRAAERHSSEAA